MRKTKYFNIRIDVYNSYVVLVLSDNANDSIKWIEKNYNTDLSHNYGATGLCVQLKQKDTYEDRILIAVATDTDHSTLYHESLHAAWYMLDMLGVKVDVNNHEALAYLQACIGWNITKIMKKYAV